MKEQAKERIIFEGGVVRELLEHAGWKMLNKQVDSELECLREKMKKSDDVNVVFSCAKKIDGIMLLQELAQEAIQKGVEASLNR